MDQQIDRETLDQILQAKDVTALSFADLVKLFQDEQSRAGHLPDGFCQTDPRNGDRVLFNSSRARRPHDNRPRPAGVTQSTQACAVCQGRTTGVVDVAALSEGLTFINKNLYPSLAPVLAHRSDLAEMKQVPGSGHIPYGLHFLQWTSSLHKTDWHNMPLADRVIVMQRLAALEHKLATDGEVHLPPAQPTKMRCQARGYVLIIKNHGHLVGGSLAHGHQQIALSNIIPRRMQDNYQFEQKHGETFSAFLLRENPAKLFIRDYGPAVLLVPYFMRRPYDMMLLVKDARKQYLYQLTEGELGAVAEGWCDAIRLMRAIMADLGKETAYNVITHNGPGAGLYFEFLPYTQESGGFEQLGLLVCQGYPESAAAAIRQYLDRLTTVSPVTDRVDRNETYVKSQDNAAAGALE
jgi:galactose-1-phosphate uridylyltransferase